MKSKIFINRITEIDNILLYFLFLIYIGLRPIHKFYEVNNILFRINITAVILVGLILYIFLRLFLKKKIVFKTKLNFLSALLLSWIILIQIVSFPFAIQYSDNGFIIYLLTVATTIIASLLIWLVGSNFQKIYNNIIRNKKIKYVTYLIYFIFVGTLIFGILIHPRNRFHIYLSGAQNYLMISDGFAILSLLIINLNNKKSYKFINGIMGIILLYTTLSRTSLYLYVFVILLFFLRDFKKYLFILFLVSILLIIPMYGEFISLEDIDFANNRMVRLLTNPSSDSSFQGRISLMKESIKKDLKNYWFLGRFMREVERTGRRGTYIHNWLSFWISYGLIPFLFFIILSIISMIKITIQWFKYRNNSLINFLFMYSLFIFISILISKAYVNAYVWFPLAAIPNINSRKEI